MSISDQQQIAQRFLAIREQAGLSQQGFADELGIAMRSEQNYERGDRAIPSEVLYRAAKRFEVDLYWLFEGESSIPQPRSGASELNRDAITSAYRVLRLELERSGKVLGDDEFGEVLALFYRAFILNTSEAGFTHLAQALLESRQEK